MSDYKYPYIPKPYYPAVMYACFLIRKYRTFNRAVKAAADAYDLDEEEIAKYVRKRQGAGQKGNKPKSAGKKYKWFIVCETVWCEADGETTYSNPEIVKGISAETVGRKYTKLDWEKTMDADYGGSFAPVYGHKVLAQFESKEEAEKTLKEKWPTTAYCT